MKKLILIILAALILYSFAAAESDLKSLSYDDLISLYRSIGQEIISRPEWKEVEVPAGVWVVGVDIPAGYYSVRPPEGDKQGFILWYYKASGIHDYYQITAGQTLGKVNLIEGTEIELNRPAVFCPPKGLDF